MSGYNCYASRGIYCRRESAAPGAQCGQLGLVNAYNFGKYLGVEFTQFTPRLGSETIAAIQPQAVLFLPAKGG